jgi:hypothetical protein
VTLSLGPELSVFGGCPAISASVTRTTGSLLPASAGCVGLEDALSRVLRSSLLLDKLPAFESDALSDIRVATRSKMIDERNVDLPIRLVIFHLDIGASTFLKNQSE